MKRLLAVLCVMLCGCAASPVPVRVAKPFYNGKTAFSATIDGINSSYSPFSAFVLPGEIVKVNATTPIRLYGVAGMARRLSPSRWEWRAPTSLGAYPMTLVSDLGQHMRVNVFVTAERKSLPHDYPMGRYPGLYMGHTSYAAPKGFLLATEDMRDVRVSPHFTLGQFFCKQPEGFPKYVILRPQLLIKLETLLEKLNQKGVRTDGFVVMSGFRTPLYNEGLGQGQYSRHIYGDAADIFVDRNGDDVMDDLNGDGKLNRKDAAWLYDLAEKTAKSPAWRGLAGGIGEYEATDFHGPFVHIDARGFEARWGR
ncbi:MAG: D-Ala-D-Ala carboxypeptidase family metallohydrolase [Rickettsiales bacterium]